MKVNYRLIKTKTKAYTLQYQYDNDPNVWNDLFSYYDKTEFDSHVLRFKQEPFFMTVLEEGSVEVEE